MQEIQACQNIVTLSPHGIYLFHGVYSLRFFILFLLLILRRELQTFWEQKLRAKYPSPLDVLHEMFPIRFTEHADGSAQITDFTASQAEICQAFALSVPQDGESRH